MAQWLQPPAIRYIIVPLRACCVTEPANRLPWQRVVGAGGEIKLPFEAGAEQRFRLQMEGVTFQGRRVNLKLHQHEFRMWKTE